MTFCIGLCEGSGSNGEKSVYYGQYTLQQYVVSAGICNYSPPNHLGWRQTCPSQKMISI